MALWDKAIEEAASSLEASLLNKIENLEKQVQRSVALEKESRESLFNIYEKRMEILVESSNKQAEELLEQLRAQSKTAENLSQGLKMLEGALNRQASEWNKAWTEREGSLLKAISTWQKQFQEELNKEQDEQNSAINSHSEILEFLRDKLQLAMNEESSSEPIEPDWLEPLQDLQKQLGMLQLGFEKLKSKA